MINLSDHCVNIFGMEKSSNDNGSRNEEGKNSVLNRRYFQRFNPESYSAQHMDVHGILNDSRVTTEFVIEEVTNILLNYAIVVDTAEFERVYTLTDCKRFLVGDVSCCSIRVPLAFM